MHFPEKSTGDIHYTSIRKTKRRYEKKDETKWYNTFLRSLVIASFKKWESSDELSKVVIEWRNYE